MLAVIAGYHLRENCNYQNDVSKLPGITKTSGVPVSQYKEMGKRTMYTHLNAPLKDSP